MLRERRENVLSSARGRFSRLFSTLDALLTLARIVGEQRSCVALKRLRLIRGLRLRGGRGLQRSKLRRERLHGEGAVDGRRPNAASGGVDDDESGAALFEREPLLGKQRVNVIPAAGAGEETEKRRLDFPDDPGRERVQAAMRLEIRGAALRAAFVRAAVIGARKAVLDLKLVAGPHQLALVVIGLDTAQGGWIDFVDRDVQMQMRAIEVKRRNPLVGRQPDRRAELSLDVLDLRGRRPLARLERDHEMIGSVAAAALVEALSGEDLHDRQHRRAGVAVCNPHGAHAAAGLIGEDVVEGLIGSGVLRGAALAKDVGAENCEIGGSPGTQHTLRDHNRNQPDA